MMNMFVYLFQPFNLKSNREKNRTLNFEIDSTFVIKRDLYAGTLTRNRRWFWWNVSIDHDFGITVLGRFRLFWAVLFKRKCINAVQFTLIDDDSKVLFPSAAHRNFHCCSRILLCVLIYVFCISFFLCL